MRFKESLHSPSTSVEKAPSGPVLRQEPSGALLWPAQSARVLSVCSYLPRRESTPLQLPSLRNRQPGAAVEGRAQVEWEGVELLDSFSGQWRQVVIDPPDAGHMAFSHIIRRQALLEAERGYAVSEMQSSPLQAILDMMALENRPARRKNSTKEQGCQAFSQFP